MYNCPSKKLSMGDLPYHGILNINQDIYLPIVLKTKCPKCVCRYSFSDKNIVLTVTIRISFL